MCQLCADLHDAVTDRSATGILTVVGNDLRFDFETSPCGESKNVAKDREHSGSALRASQIRGLSAGVGCVLQDALPAEGISEEEILKDFKRWHRGEHK